ncbi:response regulator transcription factor [Fredinandcohnia sp. QZ13]|uniref:response regulator transcription factor n=1 Tax=Fredinandcohnia sp. QZ13 TaxID=3073144 RepID=UPI00285369BC|nr:response regulator transcription factor [Fredinandcohnia sp. QZ13]MDR4887086.1 response regulator transcription factor [Fredinandcohnia sp. QZ13]
MEKPEKILLVEDDKEIARIVCDHLRKEGYTVTWASTGKEGWEDFKEEQYDLALIDLMLPEMDGYTLCKTIRLESEIPLLILSARNEDESKVKGLNLGADDYVTKPFSLEELSARISSHLRRFRRYNKKTSNENRVNYMNGLTIDFTNNLVYLNSSAVQMSSKERELLFLLAKNPLQTFSKKEIYEHIWQQEDVDGNNTVTVHIKSLRSKLGDETRSAKFIQTVWGVGYRFIGEQSV